MTLLICVLVEENANPRTGQGSRSEVIISAQKEKRKDQKDHVRAKV